LKNSTGILVLYIVTIAWLQEVKDIRDRKNKNRLEVLITYRK